MAGGEAQEGNRSSNIEGILVQNKCIGLQPARLNEQWKVEGHLQTSFQRRREADGPAGSIGGAGCDAPVGRVCFMCLVDYITE